LNEPASALAGPTETKDEKKADTAALVQRRGRPLRNRKRGKGDKSLNPEAADHLIEAGLRPHFRNRGERRDSLSYRVTAEKDFSGRMRGKVKK